ncbi:ERF017 protein [Hibiscus syriacus]|uniref:ERF017 protein n=1 Tax=Hibiscus syriacus TaxID=106335 RepID=A0A6A2WR12_HIBSY|nr:ERF017 protein [Hibiscus syriacus]
MVKPTTFKQSSSASPTEYVDISSANSSSNSSMYKGVRKRKWGRWVSEIRLPNSRERIWLGSYDSPEKAARAFDAALYCLRGRDAKFNFPENPPDIAGGQLLSPPEIQVVAARFAREVETDGEDNHNNNNNNNNSVGTEQYTSSSSVSVSDVTAMTTQVEESGHHHDEEMMDWSFLSMLDNSTNYQGMSDYSTNYQGMSDIAFICLAGINSTLRRLKCYLLHRLMTTLMMETMATLFHSHRFYGTFEAKRHSIFIPS